jgi:hypothetical protein
MGVGCAQFRGGAEHHALVVPIAPKHEFGQISLSLIAAHAMIGSDQLCCRLPIARSAKGTTDLAGFRNSVSMVG